MPKFEIKDSSHLADIDYQNYILQGVSRTFALTIPQLPSALRDIVGNGYLLCRIADTIEDDANINIQTKELLAKQFIAICNNDESDHDAIETFVQTFKQHLSQQTPAAEIDLINNTQRVINIKNSFSHAQKVILTRCVHTMLNGMIYFQTNASLNGLPDLKTMNSYCYHVAGVVGEMLTELYSDYSSEIAAQHNTLLPLSVSFGQGLQMTNILKDIWTDQKRNMCWLPQDIFNKYGITLKALHTDQKHENFPNALQELISIASGHLHNAIQYTLLIPKKERGLRLFCLWAIGMALLSLRKINNNLHFTDSKQVKISRRSVTATIMITRLTSGNNFILHILFKLLSKTLPTPQKVKLSIEQLKCPVTL